MDGICVYNIDELAAMKAIAYYREKIRDLYDICFIVDHYYDQLSPRTINSLQDTLGRHGLDFAGKMLLEQKDALIDSSYLEEAVIRTFIRLGLGDDEAPQKCISNKDHHKDISDDDDDDYLGY